MTPSAPETRKKIPMTSLQPNGAFVVNAFKTIVFGCFGAGAASLMLNLSGNKTPIVTNLTTHQWRKH